MSGSASARQGVRAEPLYIVEITPQGQGAPVMRFSHRAVEVGGLVYEPYLVHVDGVGQALDRRGRDSGAHAASIRLANLPWRAYPALLDAGEDYPLEGAACTLSECYMVDDGAGGTAPTEAELLCKGILESPAKADLAGFTCRLLGLQYRADITK